MAHRTRSRTRCQVEHLRRTFAQADGLPFADVLPTARIERAIHEDNAGWRAGTFTPALTRWAFLTQVLSPTAENALLRTLADAVAAGSVLLADRYFGGWFDLAMGEARGVGVVVRRHQGRATDFRRGWRIGSGDHAVRAGGVRRGPGHGDRVGGAGVVRAGGPGGEPAGPRRAAEAEAEAEGVPAAPSTPRRGPKAAPPLTLRTQGVPFQPSRWFRRRQEDLVFGAMTEEQWLACDEPGPMLTVLRGHASDRQLRLFACACCRAVWHLVPPGPCRDAVEASLRFADGGATAEELAAARAAAMAVATREGSAVAWAASEAAHPTAALAARAAATEVAELLRKSNPKAAAEEAEAQAGYLRDIVGDPFRPARAPVRVPALPDAVKHVVRGLYPGASREDFLLLAAELENRGCSEPAVLAHCRSAGPHVRGCWVLDLLLAEAAGWPPEGDTPQPMGSEAEATGIWAIRAALAHHLGDRRYRRVLRTVLDQHRRGQPWWPPEWGEFVRSHSHLDLGHVAVLDVCRVCCVHGCEVQERAVDGPAEVRTDSRFLAAHGTRFPYSCPVGVGGAGDEKVIWWCPECQRARTEWEHEPHG